MWYMTRIAIIFYVSLIWIASIAVMLFVAHALDLKTVTNILNVVYFDPQVGAIVGVVAGILIFMSFLLAKLIEGRRQRERTIAFENASGPVTVSLSALEDVVKRLIVQLPQVKEIRPCIIATRKGLEADIKLVLRHEANIPDLTARLQDLVRHRVEETIGIEGRIHVRVHVTKIALEDIKLGGKGDIRVGEAQVPFHGFRS